MLVVRLYVIRVWLLLKRLPLTSNISRYFESNASLCSRQTTCVNQSRLNVGIVSLWSIIHEANSSGSSCSRKTCCAKPVRKA